jgi:phosphoribosylamine-glycine ligase
MVDEPQKIRRPRTTVATVRQQMAEAEAVHQREVAVLEAQLQRLEAEQFQRLARLAATVGIDLSVVGDEAIVSALRAIAPVGSSFRETGVEDRKAARRPAASRTGGEDVPA